MGYFALIFDNRVRNIAVSDSLPEPETVGFWVDVTNANPAVQVDWPYVDGKFVEPPRLPPYTPGIIKKKWIKQRLQPAFAEIEKAAESDAEVKTWLDWFNSQETFELGSIDVIPKCMLLAEKNLITSDWITTAFTRSLQEYEKL